MLEGAPVDVVTDDSTGPAPKPPMIKEPKPLVESAEALILMPPLEAIDDFASLKVSAGPPGLNGVAIWLQVLAGLLC